MSILSKDSEAIFIYSEMQIKEYKNIANKNNRNFTCGKVSLGSTMKEFSSIIGSEELNIIMRQYPDAKIVTKGKLSNIKYTNAKEGI